MLNALSQISGALLWAGETLGGEASLQGQLVGLCCEGYVWPWSPSASSWSPQEKNLLCSKLLLP